MKNLNQFFAEQERDVEIVCFDVFDTIILRSVHPEYVKKIWSKRLAVMLNLDIAYKKVYELRNEIEAYICRKNEADKFDLEFNYEELVLQIYNEIVKLDKNLNNISVEDFAEICRELEVAIETSVQRIDENWLEFVKSLRKKKIKVVCVSDFYLTKSMMVDLFEHHGVLEYIDTIFVSSEYLLTKRSGRLYDLVLNELGASSDKVMMVGDNKHSDYEMSKEKGLKPYLVDRDEERKFYDKFMEDVSDSNKIESKLIKINSKNINTQSYFEPLAFSLFSFIEKLHTDLLRKKAKNVFFLSREGEYLIKLFEIYQKAQGFTGSQYINSHYFLVSRKSTFLPSLKPLGEENFEILFRQYRNISIYDFLSSLNFKEEEMKRICECIGSELAQKEADFPTSETFEKLLACKEFIDIYEKNRAEQNCNFKKYMNSFNVDVDKEGLNIVDVGWKGTIQDNIFRILDEAVELNGYYLGLVSSGDAKNRNNKFGLVFSGVPCKSKYYNVYNENRAVFEIVLGASHGSANKYIDRGSEVEVETKHHEKELKLFKEIIKPLQVNIEKIFIEICEVLCKRNFEEDQFEHVFSKIHAQMIFFPSKRQIEFFNNMYHFENFGVFEFTEFNKKQSVSIVNRAKNMIKLIRNPRHVLQNGFWTPVTLENLGLGFLKKIYGLYRYHNTILKIEKTNSAVSNNHNQELDKYHEKIKEKDEVIKSMTKMIDDRDKAIKSMTKMIDDRDEAIKNMTKMIDDRDIYINELELLKERVQ